jgi:hypothetical protein
MLSDRSGAVRIATAVVAAGALAGAAYWMIVRKREKGLVTTAASANSHCAASSPTKISDKAAILAANPPAPVLSEERTQGLALFNLLKAKANEAFQKNELDAALAGYQEAADCLHALGLDAETLVLCQTIQANAALVMNKQQRFEEAVNVTTFMLNNPAPMGRDLTVKVLYRRAIARKGLNDLAGAKGDLKEALMFSDGTNAEVQKEIDRIDALLAKAS